MSKNEQICKIYNFPVPSEHEELTWEEKEQMREEQALAAMRAKARLEANMPLPWYKRLGAWYERNYEQVFDGFGPGLYLLVLIFFFLVIFVQLGKLTGWWGGGW